jgi:hypothetical protein
MRDEDDKPLAADGEPFGRVANDSPWEALHKIRNGRPGERMPALRAPDLQTALDYSVSDDLDLDFGLKRGLTDPETDVTLLPGWHSGSDRPIRGAGHQARWV